MKLRNIKKLDKFIKIHRSSKTNIENWKTFVEHEDWKNLEDVRKAFAINTISESRIVFKVGGNKWRIDTKVDYISKHLFIKRVGTHEDYNKWKYND